MIVIDNLLGAEKIFVIILAGSCGLIGLLFAFSFLRHPIFNVIIFIGIVVEIFFLLLILGAEFFALLLLIVYTGVIAVLYLFVLIMYKAAPVHFIFSFSSSYRLLASIWGLWTVVFFMVCSFLLVDIGKYADYSNQLLVLDVTYLVVLFNEYYICLIICGVGIFLVIVGIIGITADSYYLS